MSIKNRNPSSSCYNININKEGYLPIVIIGAITLFFGIFSIALGIVGFSITMLMVYFFRDPKRVILKNKDIVLGPADGVVVSISDVSSMSEEIAIDVEYGFVKISIFLSVFDVHVNRMPISGTVKAMSYVPGIFSNAFYDGASFKNERQIILIENDDDEKFVIAQVSGLIARRIICDVAVGEYISAGDRFGIIKFGSRVDLYVPNYYAINVVVGQTIVGGETIMAIKNGISVVKDNFEYK